MSNQNRNPKGAPASMGGKFAEGSHDEAQSSLAVNHDSLMKWGETREMPTSDVVISEITRSEDGDGYETVIVFAPDGRYGGPYLSDSEDRVSILAAVDGIQGVVTRGSWDATAWGARESYGYEVTLTNPKTEETITFPFVTGVGDFQKRTPRIDETLGVAISDAHSVERCDGFREWAEEMGYDLETGHRRAKKTHKAHKEINEKLHVFLGDSYDEYVYGEDNPDRKVTLEKV